MKTYISQAMQGFLTPKAGLEEALDQPLYHIRNYPTTGQTKLTFFNESVGDVGNAFSNMDSNSELSKGKRQGVFEIGVAFLGGADAVEEDVADLAELIEDSKKVLEGSAFLEFKVLEKIYLVEAPLTRVPSGQGLFVGGGGIQRTQGTPADGSSTVGYASNGFPLVINRRKLRVPIPLPAQTKFNVTITWPTAITVSTASRIGIWLDGLQIRAIQ